ncbi:MAG TPA: cell envelope integrity EipB family protein [Alphaproteobacteria bacterium]|jgi:hypothetical protein
MLVSRSSLLSSLSAMLLPGLLALSGGGIAAAALDAPSAQAAPATAAVDLAPYRAIYSMKFGTMRSGGTTADARGAMYIEMAEACDGWTATQRVKLSMTNVQGDDEDSDSNYSSWESKDGRNYRFTVRNLRDGKLSEEYRGEASLGANAGAGKATFAAPTGVDVDLPKASVFPTEHVVQLIEAARAGSRQFSRVIFDGASLDGPFDVNAIIGAQAKGKGGDKLLAGPSWPVRMAFFPLQSQAAAPVYEVGVQLYENGIAQSFLLDYGGFTVVADLEKIEALPKPRC